MAERDVEEVTRDMDEVAASIEKATREEPFLLSRAELIADVLARGSTGCGSYATIGETSGHGRDVSRDYECSD